MSERHRLAALGLCWSAALGCTYNYAVDPNFDASLVEEGQYIEARGQEIPAGQITAFDFERDDIDPDTELRGFIEPDSVVTDSEAVGYRESFLVLGVTVVVDPDQVEIYRDTNDLPISADQFWSVIEIEAAGGNGYLVDIKGEEQPDGKTLTAQEVELEME